MVEGQFREGALHQADQIAGGRGRRIEGKNKKIKIKESGFVIASAVALINFGAVDGEGRGI
jgi:hypothetical protein